MKRQVSRKTLQYYNICCRRDRRTHHRNHSLYQLRQKSWESLRCDLPDSSTLALHPTDGAARHKAFTSEPRPGVMISGCRSTRTSPFQIWHFKLSRLLCLKKKKKEEVYLSNIIHDTSTDLGVKPDKDLFFFFLNVSHTNSTFFFLSFFYKKRP